MARLIWLLLVAAATMAAVAPDLWSFSPPPAVAPPRPLLIYYGSLPTAPTPQALATLDARFAGYQLVVLHSGLENPGNSSAAVVSALVQKLPAVSFYGYLALGVTHGEPNYALAQIDTDLARWRQLGVSGVLLDTAGHDYGVSTTRLGAAMMKAHQLGLRVIVNAYRPQDVLAAPWGPDDLYLAENWAYAEGQVVGPRAAYTLHSLYALEMRGVQVAATATTAAGWPFSRSTLAFALTLTLAKVPGVRWVAVAGPNYSSTSGAVLPEAVLQRSVQGIVRTY